MREREKNTTAVQKGDGVGGLTKGHVLENKIILQQFAHHSTDCLFPLELTIKMY